MSNEFDINAFNSALYAATFDRDCAETFENGFKFITETAERHCNIPDREFGEIPKSKILGTLMNDLSDIVLKGLDE